MCRSFILKWESGATGAGLTNEQLFERARKSGYANDPDDAGGVTMCGITLATYAQYCKKKGYPAPTPERLRLISYADWLAILKTMYWDRWQADNIGSQSVAEMLVDWVWASGKYGITLPQKAMDVTADGIVGPQTLAAVNSREPKQLFDLLKAERIAYIERICISRLTNAKFKSGWLNRINDIKFAAV